MHFSCMHHLHIVAKFSVESVKFKGLILCVFHIAIYRMLLAFLMIPVIQKQLDSFRQTVWNTHRIRTQKDTYLPDGVPEHIYEFPEKYGLEDCGQYYCSKRIE